MSYRLDPSAARQIRTLLKSEKLNIIEMAGEIGEDISTFFEGEDWSGLDLRNCDLTGVSFSGSILDGVTVYEDQLERIKASRPLSIKSPSVEERPEQEKPKRRGWWSHSTSADEVAPGNINEIQRSKSRRGPASISEYNGRISTAETQDLALSIFWEMEEKGLKPTVSTFNSLISRMSDASTAFELMRRMTDQGLRPNKGTYNAVSQRVFRIEDIYALLSKMEGTGIALNATAIRRFLRASENKSQAIHLMNEMRRAFRLNEREANRILEQVMDRI